MSGPPYRNGLTYPDFHPLSGRAYVIVHDHDVLSGRGVNVAQHPGNERFRALVQARSDAAYCKNYSTSEKKALADEIIRHIKSLDPPGRFLKRCGRPKNLRGLQGPWDELSEKETRKKTCQALRDCNRNDREGYAAAVAVPVDVINSSVARKQTGLSNKEYAEQIASVGRAGRATKKSPVSEAKPRARPTAVPAPPPSHTPPLPSHTPPPPLPLALMQASTTAHATPMARVTSASAPAVSASGAAPPVAAAPLHAALNPSPSLPASTSKRPRDVTEGMLHHHHHHHHQQQKQQPLQSHPGQFLSPSPSNNEGSIKKQRTAQDHPANPPRATVAPSNPRPSAPLSSPVGPQGVPGGNHKLFRLQQRPGQTIHPGHAMRPSGGAAAAPPCNPWIQQPLPLSALNQAQAGGTGDINHMLLQLQQQAQRPSPPAAAAAVAAVGWKLGLGGLESVANAQTQRAAASTPMMPPAATPTTAASSGGGFHAEEDAADASHEDGGSCLSVFAAEAEAAAAAADEGIIKSPLIQHQYQHIALNSLPVSFPPSPATALAAATGDPNSFDPAAFTSIAKAFQDEDIGTSVVAAHAPRSDTYYPMGDDPLLSGLQLHSSTFSHNHLQQRRERNNNDNNQEGSGGSGGDGTDEHPDAALFI